MNRDDTIRYCAIAVLIVLYANVAACGEGASGSSQEDPEVSMREKTTSIPEAERDPNRLWCNEHGVYEDECVICHPEIGNKPKNETQQESALMCDEHRVPEAECGICHPERIAQLLPGEGMKVRFASGASTSKAGIVTGKPASAPPGTAVEVLGQLSFDRNRLAIVSPLGRGVVLEVARDVGDAVESGETLAMVQSPDAAEATSEYLSALANEELARRTLAREQNLYKREISARKDLEEAQAAMTVSQSEISKSRQRLVSLGLSPPEIEKTGFGESGATLLHVRAPFAGTIIERNAVPGTAVEPGQTLFQVADLSTMWMNLSIPENRLDSAAKGVFVQASFDAYPSEVFEGEIAWIAPMLDPRTRMLEARAVLANAKGLLKEGLFGRASLSGAAQEAGIAIPASAVQDIDGRAVVFRRLEDDLYEARIVTTRAGDAGRVAVLEGLATDDEIVTQGSYIVKSELLKARLGAGCTDN